MVAVVVLVVVVVRVVVVVMVVVAVVGVVVVVLVVSSSTSSVLFGIDQYLGEPKSDEARRSKLLRHLTKKNLTKIFFQKIEIEKKFDMI